MIYVIKNLKVKIHDVTNLSKVNVMLSTKIVRCLTSHLRILHYFQQKANGGSFKVNILYKI